MRSSVFSFFLVALVGLFTFFALTGAASAATGVLYQLQGDDFAHGRTTGTEFRVATPGADPVLSDRQSSALLGAKVSTDGLVGPRNGLRGSAEQVAAAPELAPLGPKTTLVAILSLSNAPAQTITASAVRSTYFTGSASANALFQQQSNGGVRLTGIVNSGGDAVGPLAVGASGAGCNIDAITAAADTALLGAGYDPSAYDFVSYMLPRLPDCGWGGLGQMPGHKSWINGYNQVSVIAHEIGHNFGVHHANVLRCTDSWGTRTPLSDNCSSNEYGDDYDVMGLYPRLMSSFHRAELSQLVSGWSLETKALGTYSLESADSFSGEGTRLLMYPRKRPGVPVTQWFAFESRSSSDPFDNFAASPRIVGGVLVRLVNRKGISQTQLIDANPGTIDDADEAFRPGESFSDPVSGSRFDFGTDGFSPTVKIAGAAFTDDAPPSAPGWPSAYRTAATRVSLSWASSDDDIEFSHYEIERNGAVVGSTANFTFVDSGAPTTAATYRIVAVDAVGNRSASTAMAVPAWKGSGTSTGGSKGGSSGASGASSQAPAIEFLGYSSRWLAGGRGWLLTAKFRTSGGRSVVTANGHRVKTTSARKFRVKFRFPLSRRRVTVRVRTVRDGLATVQKQVFRR